MFAGRKWANDGDELVGQCIWQGQQVPCYRRGEGVEGRAELGIWQGALNGFQVFARPSLLNQEALQALAGVEVNVSFIQQPLRAIEELTGH